MAVRMIGTWRMAAEGIRVGATMLEDGADAADAVEQAVRMVEDYPYYKSVGYGGLPNEHGEVELDAAFMDGDTLDVGAVANLCGIADPISVARRLSREKVNSFLVGRGAYEYALRNGHILKEMLTERARKIWQLRCAELKRQPMNPYDGHDTVGIIGMDKTGKICVGTSTSGLFMKRRGRVGDSPVSGSGFYADSKIGAATATGLGEDIMKGCLSYEIVRRMEAGLLPQAAADSAVLDLSNRLAKRGSVGDISVVCIDASGRWGAATNLQEFSFTVYDETDAAGIYVAQCCDGKTRYAKATGEWLEAYQQRIKKRV